MHGVRCVTERVENQMFEAMQEFFGRVRDGAEVGQIGGGADSEAEDSQGPMLDGYRRDARAEKIEWPVDRVEVNLRNRTLRRLRLEYIGESSAENRDRFLRSVYRDRGSLLLIEGANVVESENVIGVRVCVEDGVETIKARARSAWKRKSGVVSMTTLRPL